MRLNRLDILTTVTALAALSVTGLTVWERPSTTNPKDQRIPEWEQLLDGGHRIGSADAPVQILEFGDYECPACQSLHSTVKQLLDEFSGSVAFVYRHFPLSYHKHAYTAARAAECAGQQARFLEYHNLLYEHPDQLGRWVELAQRAGVPHLQVFDACVADSAQVSQVEEDIQAAGSFGASGTPAVIINGLYLAGNPDPARLRKLITKELARKSL